MSIFLASIIAVIVSVLAWLWLKPRRDSPPAYPGALPVIGHAYLLIGDKKYKWNFFQKMLNYSLEKGGVIELYLGPFYSYYVLTDPEDSLTLANECLNKSYLYDFAKEFLHNGLVTAEASTWKVHRKLLNPAFHQQVLNTFLNEINVQARSLVSQLASEVGKEPFEVRKYFVSFTLKTVCRTSLGLDAEDQTMIDKDFAEAFDDLLAIMVERGQKFWLHLSYTFNWSALKRRQDELITRMDNFINPVIRKRKSDLRKNTISNQNSDSLQGKFKPVLDQLLQLAEKQDVFTDDDIREHLDTIVVASYDTTSAAMTYLLLLIGSHRDIQEKIFQEIQEVLEHDNADLTKQDLQKLVYLEAVIKETLRLYSVIPLVARKVDTDIKLKNYTLRAGNTCVLGLHGLNRHPMWGADAENFRPERWLDAATLPDNFNVFAAFGIGKRNCIGKSYGMMVMKTALAHILRRYYVTSDISNLESEFGVVMVPVSGNLIRLTLRSELDLHLKSATLNPSEIEACF